MKIQHTISRDTREHSRMLRWAIVGAAGGLWLGGCVSSNRVSSSEVKATEVRVGSLARPKAEDAISYQIRNANPYVDTASLQYKEVVSSVITALSVKGMYEAPPGTPADWIVDLDYGIRLLDRRYRTDSTPTYGSVPGEATPVSRTVGIDAEGHPINQNVYEQQPSTFGVNGSREVRISSDIFEKHLRLSARGNKITEGDIPAPEVWTVVVVSEGEDRELRKALPILAAVAIEYIDKDSQGLKAIRRKDTDKSVVFVK